MLGGVVNIKQLLVLIIGMKVTLTLMFLSVAWVQRLLSQRWFTPGIDIKVVKAELKAGKEVDVLDNDGYTGLMRAAAEGAKDRVELFLEFGADVNMQSQNMYRYTPLHLACQNGNFDTCVEIAKLLVENKANVDVGDYEGMQPLHFAMYIDHLDKRSDLVRFLVDHGADINAQNDDGDTIFHLAVQQNDRDWAVMLIKMFGSKIDWNIKNKSGWTPFTLAQTLGRTYIIKAICEVASPEIKESHCDDYFYL